MSRVKLDGNAASVHEACDNGLLAGAVTLLWQGGKVLQVNEIGYRDVEAGLPMQRDTVFRIASMTKPVTVAAAMSLVEQGKLALRDPVSRWLPELADMTVLADPHGPLEATVPAMRPITVEDLMTHRSGLAYTFSVTGPIARAYSTVSLRQDADHWLAEVAQLPLVHQPGERLTYSHATEVLGIVLSRIEGKPLQDVLAERILAPLGMTDTGFYRHTRSASPGSHHVPTRRRQPAQPRRDGPGRRSRRRGSARAAVGCGRPSTTIWRSPGCCWAAARLTACGCCPRSRCG